MLFEAPSLSLWPFHLQSKKWTPADQHRRSRLSPIDSLELTPHLFPVWVLNKGNQCTPSRGVESHHWFILYISFNRLSLFSPSGFKMSPDEKVRKKYRLAETLCGFLARVFPAVGIDSLLKSGQCWTILCSNVMTSSVCPFEKWQSGERKSRKTDQRRGKIDQTVLQKKKIDHVHDFNPASDSISSVTGQPNVFRKGSQQVLKWHVW